MAVNCVILPNSAALGANYVKVVEYQPILSATEMWLEESSFQQRIMAIFGK